MGAAIAFGISLSALGAFLLLKHFEFGGRSPLYPKFRTRADAFVLAHAMKLSTYLPRPHPDWLKLSLRFLAHEASIVLLRVLHFLERRLLTLINMIKGRGTIRHDETVSEFLKSVAAHKKNGDRKGKIYG